MMYIHLLLFHLYRWGHWGSRIIYNLPGTTWLVSGGAGTICSRASHHYMGLSLLPPALPLAWLPGSFPAASLPLWFLPVHGWLASSSAVLLVASSFQCLPRVGTPYLMAQLVKNLPAMREIWVWSLDREDPLEKGMATHSSILAWRIPWTSPWGCKESDMTEWLSLSLSDAQHPGNFHPLCFSGYSNFFVTQVLKPDMNENIWPHEFYSF